MKKWLIRGTAGIVVLALVLAASVWVLLRTQWLREQIRIRAIYEVEKATGGKVELRKFDFDPSLLHASIEGFVLHGTEPVTEAPLVSTERVDVDLKIVSLLKKDIDLKSIRVTRPSVRILVDANGKTNFPTPNTARKSDRNFVQQVLRLAVEHYEINDATVEYNSRKNNFSVQGRNLQAGLNFDPRGPAYVGTVRSNAMQVKAPPLPDVPVDMTAAIRLEGDAIHLDSFHLDSRPTIIDGSGRIDSFSSPHGQFSLRIDTDLSESDRLIHLKGLRGPLKSSGNFVWAGGSRFRYEGDLQGDRLSTTIAGFNVTPIQVRGRLVADNDRVEVFNVAAASPDGKVRGKAIIEDYKTYRVEVEASEAQLQALWRRVGQEELGYSASVAGPVRVEGSFRGSSRIDADLTLTPSGEGAPLRGTARVGYDTGSGELTIGQAQLATRGTRLEAGGTMSQTLRVNLSTNNLEGLRPALVLAGVRELPVRLDGGNVLFEGTVSGSLKEPLVAGQVRGMNVVWQDVKVDAASSTLVASSEKLSLTRFSVALNGATVTGSGTLGLRRWRVEDTSPVTADFTATSVNVGEVRRQFKLDAPLDGLLNMSAKVTGTVGDPQGQADFDWFRPAWGDERVDRIRGSVRHQQNVLTVSRIEGTRDASRVVASGSFTHAKADFRNGSVAAEFDLTGVDLGQIATLNKIRSGIAGAVTAKAKVRGDVQAGQFVLRGVDGEARLPRFELDRQPYGELTVTAATTGSDLQLNANGNIRGSAITGTSSWKLEPEYPGTAKIEFATIPFRVLDELRPSRVVADPWPFVGGFRGSVNFRGPATDIDRWRVDVTLPEISARPSRRQTLPGTATVQDFELRNEGPVVLSAEGRTITVRSAHFVAKDTNVTVSGTFSLAERRPWDLKVNGGINLAGVRAFSPEILAAGTAKVEANITGALDSPQVFGGLDLQNASLNMDGIPNGLDKVTGRVVFDRRRATIDNKLTAESGGGTLSLSGFLDFAGEETFYRLQAQAMKVRIRYPEGVSTVADANLSLSGSTERSLLAGTVTVLRSGFTPRTDIGSLLAQSGRSNSAVGEPNRFLSNMQLDIKVRTAPDTQFTTSLTSDLQGDANLEVRGSGARPSVLGRLSISQGEINFFGNKYSIRRGEVSFYNPTRVEPILDMDLETRVRGITVTINFSGPVDKLNVSYRSDPPLQSAEIIALLTVGRSPTSSTVGSSQSAARGSFLESGANSLLGSAISAPISSQLQRFFGVSRLKIDPTLSGLEGTPQARVTVEQQVSRDVTITFATNLNRSQQQVVRLEWNLSRQWSLIALRDENGNFGIDFQFRKQVK